jgi:hypothetical protein
LSKAQLARKRANDREAQRNFQQRTKDYIASLEKKVQELEQGGRSSSVERVIKRNKELEEEIKLLRAQVAVHQGPLAPTQAPLQIPEELLMPQKVTLDWMPAEPLYWLRDDDSTASYTSAVATSYLPTLSSVAYNDEARSSALWFRGSNQQSTSVQHNMLAISGFDIRLADIDQGQSNYTC